MSGCHSSLLTAVYLRPLLSRALRSVGYRCTSLGLKIHAPPPPPPPPAPTFAERFGLTDADLRVLARNREIKAAYKGRRGFVIGTGPSIGRQDLSVLAEEVTVGMSGLWKHPILKQWQPSFYCFGDATFFDGSPQMDSYFGHIRERVPATRYVGLLRGFETVRDRKLLDPARAYFVLCDRELRLYEGTELNFEAAVPSVQSTSQLAIYTAIWAGCNPIYLIGLDHDWLSYNEYDRHFYDGLAGLEQHPRAVQEIENRKHKGYVTSLESVWHLWQGYQVLQRIADAHGVKIYNATDGGFLDVFDRVDFASLFVAPREVMSP
jgi:hypothetical protein